MHGVIDAAIRAGRLPEGARDLIEIQVGKPRVATRELEVEAKVNEIYHPPRHPSPNKPSPPELGLDHAQEQENLTAEGVDIALAE